MDLVTVDLVTDVSSTVTVRAATHPAEAGIASALDEAGDHRLTLS